MRTVVLATPGGEAVIADGWPVGNYLEISVQGTGTGIVADELAPIFDLY